MTTLLTAKLYRHRNMLTLLEYYTYTRHTGLKRKCRVGDTRVTWTQRPHANFFVPQTFLVVLPFSWLKMWRPATKQITGTNEGKHIFMPEGLLFITPAVPLGQRRRFGPAPTEDSAPPQLAQPSPSAYPRPPQQDPDSPSRGRDQSPANGGAAGKLSELENDSRTLSPPLSVHWNLTAALETFYSS
jgi:hypothetical protein